MEMGMMYAFESRARGKLFHVIVIGCFVAALLLFGFGTSEGVAYPAIYQFTALLGLTAGTYLLVRYGLKIYRYEISENGIVSAVGDKQYDLVITEIVGKRIRVVTRVAVRDIASVTVLPRKKRGSAATLFGDMKIFHYTNHFFDPVSCYLALPEEGSVVVIPYDERMIRSLEVYCKVTKEFNV